MRSTQVGNHVIIKLDDGEDLFPCLETVAGKHQMDSGIVLGGLGMLKEFEIGFFDHAKGKYEDVSVSEPHELISMVGSLAVAENGQFIPHIHASLGGSDHRLMGGHLKRARVAILNEIAILKLPAGTLTRRLNQNTGLYELSVG